MQAAGAERAQKRSIKQLDQARSLACAVRGDHLGASPYAVVDEVDKLGLDSEVPIADLLLAVPNGHRVLNGSSGKLTTTMNFITSPQVSSIAELLGP